MLIVIINIIHRMVITDRERKERGKEAGNVTSEEVDSGRCFLWNNYSTHTQDSFRI